MSLRFITLPLSLGYLSFMTNIQHEAEQKKIQPPSENSAKKIYFPPQFIYFTMKDIAGGVVDLNESQSGVIAS
ncbi:MAG: hypothetical protein K0S08_86 [Gammaproteobacteria bacterium]|nr:hypothetical protein [Gammaproteobacteria bacterium]